MQMPERLTKKMQYFTLRREHTYRAIISPEHVIAFHHRKTLLGEWTSRQFFPSQLNQRGVFSQLVTEDNNNVLPFLLNWKHISSDESAKPKEEGGSVFWISTYFNREEAHQAKIQEYEFGIRLLKDENDADNGPKVVAKLFKCLSHGEDIKVEGSRKQVCSPTNPFLESFCNCWRLHNSTRLYQAF